MSDDDLIYLDGYDQAVLGYGNRYPYDRLVIYSKRKIIDIMQEQGLDLEDALELFDETIGRACLGEGTPIICDDLAIPPYIMQANLDDED